MITRTDAATPGGRRVGPETVPEGGVFEFQDSQAAPGKVTYTLSFAGDDTYGPGLGHRVRAGRRAQEGDHAHP